MRNEEFQRLYRELINERSDTNRFLKELPTAGDFRADLLEALHERLKLEDWRNLGGLIWAAGLLPDRMFTELLCDVLDNHKHDSYMEAVADAIKLITKVEGGDRRIFSLISLLPTVYRIDRNRFSDLSELTAKSINSIPSLNVEDKPQTENIKNYVNTVMNINWNLLPVLTKLLTDNKSEAANLAGRINKKEIRIIADYALLTDSMVQKAKSEKGQK